VGEQQCAGAVGARRRPRDTVGSYIRSITRKEEQHAR
jgi:hypothetical protein